MTLVVKEEETYDAGAFERVEAEVQALESRIVAQSRQSRFT